MNETVKQAEPKLSIWVEESALKEKGLLNYAVTSLPPYRDSTCIRGWTVLQLAQLARPESALRDATRKRCLTPSPPLSKGLYCIYSFLPFLQYQSFDPLPSCK